MGWELVRGDAVALTLHGAPAAARYKILILRARAFLIMSVAHGLVRYGLGW